jgi:hypothetical protein
MDLASVVQGEVLVAAWAGWDRSFKLSWSSKHIMSPNTIKFVSCPISLTGQELTKWFAKTIGPLITID